MPVEQAVGIIEAGRGTNFDPAVVDAFHASLPTIIASDRHASPSATKRSAA